jgi:hypothetical protein
LALSVVLVAIFAINIFFGYWRSNTKRFTINWILAVHVPVPLAIGLRLLLLGWNWLLLPVFVADFFVGQYAGGFIRRLLSKQGSMSLSSCLVMDLARKYHIISTKQ